MARVTSSLDRWWSAEPPLRVAGRPRLGSSSSRSRQLELHRLWCRMPSPIQQERGSVEQGKAMGTQATYGQRGRSERSAASHNTERLRCRWLCADNDYPVENILTSFSACFQRSQRPTKRLTGWLVSTRTGYHGRDTKRGLTCMYPDSPARVGHLSGDF